MCLIISVLDYNRFEQTSQVEYGSPKELLENENGLLRSLVNESADKEHLLSLAGGTAGPDASAS